MRAAASPRTSDSDRLRTIDEFSEVVLRVAVTDAVARLPQRQREVITLRYLVDLSQEQVAQALRIRPGTVAQHTHRALTRLRDLLDDPRKDTTMTVTTHAEAVALVGTDRPVRARVTGRERAGFSADIGIPAVYRGRGQRRPRWAGSSGPDHLGGAEFDCVVVDIEADGRPLVTDALTAESAAEFAGLRECVAALRPGQRFRGRVAVVLPFGAMVDVDGLRGLIHTSLLDPQNPLCEGSELEVEVVDTDMRLSRISLRPV